MELSPDENDLGKCDRCDMPALRTYTLESQSADGAREFVRETKLCDEHGVVLEATLPRFSPAEH